MNSGIIIRQPLISDWISGEESGILYEEKISDGNWDILSVSAEKQKGRLFDTMACVSFSALNCVEIQVNWLIKNKKISDDSINRLKELGFIDDLGLFNSSDRFTAKMSGTTKSGNYLTNVWDSIRNHGLLPEKDWSFDLDKFTWDEYYKEIPRDLKDKALKILDILEFKYEFVFYGTGNVKKLIEKHLKQAPLQIASPTCQPWSVTDVIGRCGDTKVSHATSLYGIIVPEYYKDFDHYEPFWKKLSYDYYIPFVIKGVVIEKEVISPPNQFKYNFKKTLKHGQRNEDIKMLQNALKIDGCFPLSVASTGFYGNITKEAVKKFQYKYNVASQSELQIVNGMIVGPKTLKKLNELFNK